MICVLQVVSPGLTTFLDPGPDIYLAMIVPPVAAGAAGTPVTCAVYPVTPANQVVVAGALPSLLINNSAQLFTNPPVTGNPMQLNFSVGNKPAIEIANSWNSINITVQDNTGTQTAFSTIWYFISAGGGSGTTTPPPPTTTPAPPTTTHGPSTTIQPLEGTRRSQAKPKKKGKR